MANQIDKDFKSKSVKNECMLSLEILKKINDLAENNEEKLLMLIDLARLDNSEKILWLEEYREFLKD
ncbi:MAG: hypothetical protein ACTSRG_08085 [Candidatus Helarchaeota archaeon]